jgi:hypothetical protein
VCAGGERGVLSSWKADALHVRLRRVALSCAGARVGSGDVPVVLGGVLDCELVLCADDGEAPRLSVLDQQLGVLQQVSRMLSRHSPVHKAESAVQA